MSLVAYKNTSNLIAMGIILWSITLLRYTDGRCTFEGDLRNSPACFELLSSRAWIGHIRFEYNSRVVKRRFAYGMSGASNPLMSFCHFQRYVRVQLNSKAVSICCSVKLRFLHC